jgi:two-component system nitrate/nitrite response regulator NarL
MRLLIHAYHVLFAESLAHVLDAQGKDIVGVTHEPAQLLDALRRLSVDVCMLDMVSGTDAMIGRLAAVREAAPGTHVVLLTGDVDDVLVAAGRAAGVRGIGDKRRPLAEVIDLLDRVGAGQLMMPADPVARATPSAAVPSPRNDAQRLAVFLTQREREVLSALVCGDDTNKLARSLGIAATTARCHIQNVLTKLGAHSRLEAATSAVRYGMVSPDTGAWLRPEPHRAPAAPHAVGSTADRGAATATPRTERSRGAYGGTSRGRPAAR